MGCTSSRAGLRAILALAILSLALPNNLRAADAPPSAKAKAAAAIEQGEKLLAEGDYAGAKAAYETALRLGDESAAVYGGRAAARIGLDDLDGAIADLKEAIARDPGDLGQKFKVS